MGFSLGGSGAAGGGSGQRLVARLVDREDPVEAGDLEDLGDVLVGADERQRPTGRAQPLDAANQHAERGRVDEGRLGNVDDESLLAVLDHLDETLLELRSRVEVDLAAKLDDVGLLVDFLILNLEVHLALGPFGGLSVGGCIRDGRASCWISRPAPAPARVAAGSGKTAPAQPVP